MRTFNKNERIDANMLRRECDLPSTESVRKDGCKDYEELFLEAEVFRGFWPEATN